MAVHAVAPPPGTISTIAGASLNSGPATTVPQQPWGVAAYGSTLYLSDQQYPGGNVVRAVNINTGQEIVVAGDGASGTYGDGGPAIAAALNGPRGLAVDGAGNLYIATFDRVRKVNTSGVISLVKSGFTDAFGVAADAQGDVFVADSGQNKVLRVDHSTLAMTPIAGNGMAGYMGDGLLATAAELRGPEGVAVDSTATNIWIADTSNQVIRKVTAGTITTVAGQPSNSSGCPPGGPALTTPMVTPIGIAVDSSGNLLIADGGADCIRELSGTTLTTFAGTGFVGYTGDGGPATSAKLAYPTTVTIDGSGNVYFADSLTYRVRKISAGIITTIAGTGTLGGCTLNGDGDQATTILLCDTSGIAVDSSGDVFFSDRLMDVVRKVTPAGGLSTVAGNGTPGHSGDGQAATAAQLNAPGAIAIDAAGDLLILERAYPATVRMVDTSGVIHTVAGGGMNIAPAGPVPALSVYFSQPQAIAVASNGRDFYIADTYDGMVDKVTVGSSDMIARVAGGGTNFPGDGGPATNAKLYTPSGVAVDGSGNLYIADPGASRLYKVDAGGIITTVAVFGSTGAASSVEIAPTGQIVVIDAAERLVSLTSAGQIPIAGNGSFTFSGDGGPAYLAGVSAGAFAFDAAGDIFVADGSTANLGRVRRIQAFAAPSAPLSVSATPNIHYATVQWSAPAATGGLPVAQYTVRSYQGATPGPSVVTGATTAIVGGLAAGVPYTFTVSAFNGWVSGPASAASSPVTPAVLTNTGDILTYAGSVGSGPATKVGQFPYSVALAGTHLYVGDFANPVIRDVDLSSGQEGVLAGNDSSGYSGDGGQAPAAMINGAGAMTYCGGQTYFADTFNYAIRKIDATGHITTVAGTGQFGYAGDGGPATSARFGRVFGLACRTGGGLYVSDSDNGAVRIIDAGGTIRNFWSGFSFPTGITELGAQDVVAVSDSGADSAVWSLTANSANLLAGRPGSPGYSGDNGPAGNGNSQLYDPRGLAFVAGSLYIADRGNNAIRVVNFQTGVITTAMMFYVNQPAGLVADTANNLIYVANTGGFTVMRGDVNSMAFTNVAGNGTPSLSGDGGAATQAQLGNPYAVAVDSNGNLFIADNQNSVIRKIGPTGIITTVAGNGVPGNSGDGGPATAAQLKDPRGVAVAPNGDVYISDTGNASVRKVDHTTGFISTVVRSLYYPRGVAVDATGNVYIADTGANEVLVLRADGSVPVFAGTGTAGYSGDGGAATSAQLNRPRGLAIDASSNVYISDSDNNRVRRVDHATGIITTVAGNGTAGLGGDGRDAKSAELNFPFGLAVDVAGNLYIADALNERIRVVDTHGIISTVVGACGGIAGFSGDGGPASIAEVNTAYGVAVDAFGDLFIAETNSNRVRAAAGLAGLRESSCPGPSGTPGSRGASPTNVTTSPPMTRIVEGRRPAPVIMGDAILPGRISKSPVQPSRTAEKPAPAQTAQNSKPGATQPAPAVAPPAPEGASAQARGRAPATVVSGRSQPSLTPWGALGSLLVLVPAAFLTLVVTLFRRRRRKRLQS